MKPHITKQTSFGFTNGEPLVFRFFLGFRREVFFALLNKILLASERNLLKLRISKRISLVQKQKKKSIQKPRWLHPEIQKYSFRKPKIISFRTERILFRKPKRISFRKIIKFLPESQIISFGNPEKGLVLGLRTEIFLFF